MASIIDKAVGFIKTALDVNLIGFAQPGATELAKEVALVQSKEDLFRILTRELGIPTEVMDDLVTTTQFAEIAKDGTDVYQWWQSLPQQERGAFKYGPEEYRQAVTFFNGWGNVQKVCYLIAVLAALATILLGLTEAVPAARNARQLLRAGRPISEIAGLFQIERMLVLPKIALPATIAALAAAGGWAASTQLATTGDLLTYLRQNVAKAETQAAGIGGIGTGSGISERKPVTRITMSTTTKPKVLTGTLFSSILKRTDAFERKLDDAITDKEDLRMDAQMNLQRWLRTLPGRMLYTIDIRNNPFDENGVKQTGMWLTLTLLIRTIGGAAKPIDTILLGPIDPQIYNPKASDIQNIQYELPGLLTAEEIAQVQLPTGDLSIVDKQGVRVPVQLGESIAPPGTDTSMSSGTATRPYIRFAGSPDVFDRQTGKYISATDATRLGINQALMVDVMPNPRPEVKTESDFAKWSGKDLTNWPAGSSTTSTAASASPNKPNTAGKLPEFILARTRPATSTQGRPFETDFRDKPNPNAASTFINHYVGNIDARGSKAFTEILVSLGLLPRDALTAGGNAGRAYDAQIPYLLTRIDADPVLTQKAFDWLGLGTPELRAEYRTLRTKPASSVE